MLTDVGQTPRPRGSVLADLGRGYVVVLEHFDKLHAQASGKLVGVFTLAVNARLIFPIVTANPKVCDRLSGLFLFHPSSLPRCNLYVGGVIRSTFVIDAEGKIEKAMYAVKATGHVGKLRRDLGID